LDIAGLESVVVSQFEARVDLKEKYINLFHLTTTRNLMNNMSINFSSPRHWLRQWNGTIRDWSTVAWLL